MSKTIGEIFFSMASALGLPQDDPSLEAIKNNKELFTSSASQALENLYEKEFITVTAAKNNGEIKKHFNGLALGTIDNKLDEMMTEFGFDDNTKAEIKKQDSTYKRNETLIRKLKAASEKADKAPDGKEKDKLLKEVENLNQQILQTASDFEKKLQDNDNKWIEKIYGKVLTSKLTERPLIDSFDGGKTKIPQDLILNTAKGYLEKAYSEKGAKPIFDHDKEEIKLVQAANPELPYMENHKVVSFDQFRDSVLANNNLIKVTTTPTPRFTTPTITTPEKPLSPRDQRMLQQADEALENLKNAPSVLG